MTGQPRKASRFRGTILSNQVCFVAGTKEQRSAETSARAAGIPELDPCLAWVQREQKAAAKVARFGAHFTQIITFSAKCSSREPRGFLVMLGSRHNRITDVSFLFFFSQVDF